MLDWKARTAIRSIGKADDDVLADAEPGAATELCYACHTMMTSRSRGRGAANDVTIPLPHWTGTTLAQRRAEMHAQVAEFIIDEDEDAEP